jgi:hypothetical protein
MKGLLAPPQPEEVLVSFASEPGRDDSNLPPVNIVIPDDARELDRDVLAYRREQRARRRRQRIMRLFGPFGRREFGGHAAILPLIATCVALSMLAGAMLSVITISPASAPTLTQSPGAQSPTRTALPDGTVSLDALDGRTVAVRSLTTSAIALVPEGCDCGPALASLAEQAAKAHVNVYFAAFGTAMPQLAGLTTRYGDRTAVAVYDTGGVLEAAYHPVVLTVLLVYRDATAKVRTNFQPGVDLGPDLSQLSLPASQAAS